MTVQKDLFGSDDRSQSATMPIPTARGPKLTPQQQRFNKLIARIENLTRTLAEHQQLADGHRLRHATLLEPLIQQQQALTREMVLFLHDRLLRKGWTRTQRHTMSEMLCSLAYPFAMEGDAEMLKLHDHHSEISFAAQQKAVMAGAEVMMKDVLGVSLAGKGEFESVEEMLHEGLRQAQDKAESEQEDRREKAWRKPGKRQQKAVQAQQDAQSTLRDVYRKLASALHPDRELDAAERERKAKLMSEVNTAYERRDLLVLLQLQLGIEQITPHAIGNMAKEKLDAMMTLLGQQASSLEIDLYQTKHLIREEFDLPPGSAISAATLTKHMNVLEHDQRSSIKAMQRDLGRIQDDEVFKRWLKEQREGMDARSLSDLLAMGMFDPPPRGRR